MAKKIYKDYKGYFYKDNGIIEFLDELIPTLFFSVILTVIIPPVGFVLDIINIPIMITGVALGTNLIINLNHSRKLFETINNGDISEIERRLDRISKKFDSNKKCIFNNIRDKDGNTLIDSIIKSNINEEKKMELIGKMIDNGADITSILEKNTNDTNDKTLIEKITKEKGINSKLVKFLVEKCKFKLNSRKTKYESILEAYNKKLENKEKEINNIEAKIKKREKEVKTGFHPFKKIAIKSLNKNLENLKEEKEMIKTVKNVMESKINSKMKEKVTNKRTILNRILNLNLNEEFRDKQIQIK